MPIKKLMLKPGINKENTSYASEGGYYEGDKIRFRQGTPEKIGGWQRISPNTFLGVCRSLHNWYSLTNQNLIGVGTNLKFYIENGGAYFDITPLRDTQTLNNPFTTTSGSPVVLVTDAAQGFEDQDFVGFSGASAVGGITLSGQFQISKITDTTYSIVAPSNATSTATGGGTVTAAYEINTGPEYAIPFLGWGAGSWGGGPWGVGQSTNEGIRLWSQANFGEDLILAPAGGALYIWKPTNGLATKATLLNQESGASQVPVVQNGVIVSDINRFLFCFGANDIGTTISNPMNIRWCDQENATEWSPSSTNQAGGLILSKGSRIVTGVQARQELLVWTDSALYSLQYVGAPLVWTAQLVGENTSTMSKNSVVYANGVAFWMGQDKFYTYDGTVKPLKCDLRKYVFSDFNHEQATAVFSGTNEAYHEVWWFYCSGSSTTVDRYVVYNYLDGVWYYGTMSRTAWLESGVRANPLAATYSNNLVDHETGVDDNEGSVTQPIYAYAQTADFDLDDGHKFMFINKILPDMSFEGSEAPSPSATITLTPLRGSGAGYTSPKSVGGAPGGSVVRSAVLPVEQYTDQISTRIRGRQVVMKVESSAIGVTWQLGVLRLDMRPDGRR